MLHHLHLHRVDEEEDIKDEQWEQDTGLVFSNWEVPDRLLTSVEGEDQLPQGLFPFLYILQKAVDQKIFLMVVFYITLHHLKMELMGMRGDWEGIIGMKMERLPLGSHPDHI